MKTKAMIDLIRAGRDTLGRRVLLRIADRLEELDEYVLVAETLIAAQSGVISNLRCQAGMRPGDEGIYQAALSAWGEASQIAMVAEEAAELAVAAMHFLRGRGTGSSELAEEAADMEIMLGQLRVVMGDEIDKQKADKLCRLAESIRRTA